MRNSDQINASPSSADAVELKDVGEEAISFQVLQRLARIENRLSSMESRIDERLATLEARGAGGTRKVVTEKPNIRNTLISMFQKGWTSETEAMEKTGWQTIGVRSLITKLRTNGFSVEVEERDGVPYYRMPK